MKRKTSPEAEARRDKRRAVAKAVAAMTPEQRAGIVARHGTLVTIEGHALSVHNACMILTQYPTASVVGGFQQWKRAGRAVRKGEHALALWVPVKSKAEEGAAPDELTTARPGFVLGNVFDVTQTDEIAAEQAA